MSHDTGWIICFNSVQTNQIFGNKCSGDFFGNMVIQTNTDSFFVIIVIIRDGVIHEILLEKMKNFIIYDFRALKINF